MSALCMLKCFLQLNARCSLFFEFKVTEFQYERNYKSRSSILSTAFKIQIINRFFGEPQNK
jgi:hypothetical protein